MHSSWLVEVASIWAFHASSRIEEDLPFPTEAVNEYWVRNRVRFNAWNSMISTSVKQLDSPSVAFRVRGWQKLKRVIEEVLLAEPMARVCVAVAARLEDRQIDNDTRSILHNVYMSHQEVRNRCLKAIMDGVDRGLIEADELNSLRHYLEHWTDMLLGYFASDDEAMAYSHSPERVADFASEYSERMLGEQAKVVWSLLIASCRTWLDKHLKHNPISPKMNQQICESALAMIHPDLFDSMGLIRSHLVKRIERGLDQAGETLRKLEDGSWEAMSSVIAAPSRPQSNRVPF